jgi:Uma2 family endonuclease
MSETERDRFPPLCPVLVVELARPSDEPQALRREMAASIANGSSLGWLLLTQFRTVKCGNQAHPKQPTLPCCSAIRNGWSRALCFRAR